MSKDAIRAFASLAPQIPRLLAALDTPHSQRAAAAAVTLVGQRLAYRYDPTRRGYVDDSAGQLADDLGMSLRKVKRCLPLLEASGLWVAGRHGGSRDRYGSRRTPGPELCAAAHRLGLTLSTPQTALELGPLVVRDTQELGPLVVRDTQELGPLVVRDTQELGPLVALTRTTGGSLPIEKAKQKDDDDARDMSGRSSSSSNVDLLIDLTARALARKANKRGQRSYIAGIARNIRAERLEEIHGYLEADLTLEEALARMLDDEPEPWDPPPVDHTTDACQCPGDGWTPDPTEDGYLIRCPGPAAIAV